MTRYGPAAFVAEQACSQIGGVLTSTSGLNLSRKRGIEMQVLYCPVASACLRSVKC